MMSLTHSRRRGMTIIEVTLAGAIASMAGIAMISVFTLTARFTAQGFTETRNLHNTAIAIEKVSRVLNHSYRPDAQVAANRIQISADGGTIDFTVPLENGADEPRRIRFDSNAEEVHYERFNGGGYVGMDDGPLLTDVTDFSAVNQEGIISLVVGLEIDMGRNGVKRYTMVGRALPRNL